eukprot:UN10676
MFMTLTFVGYDHYVTQIT